MQTDVAYHCQELPELIDEEIAARYGGVRSVAQMHASDVGGCGRSEER